jgi:hypothetical protein
MKLIDRSRLIIVLAIALAGITQAQAQQEFKTNVSVREQLVNGTVAGAQYGPKKIGSFQQAVVVNKSENKQSLSEQIKNGTLGGMRSAPGGGGNKFKANVQAAKSGGAKGPMASEVKEEVKKVPVTTITLPTQGKEPAAVGAEPVKTPVLPMQGENVSPASKEPVKNNN